MFHFGTNHNKITAGLVYVIQEPGQTVSISHVNNLCAYAKSMAQALLIIHANGALGNGRSRTYTASHGTKPTNLAGLPHMLPYLYLFNSAFRHYIKLRLGCIIPNVPKNRAAWSPQWNKTKT